MRVVFTVLDALPVRHVGRDTRRCSTASHDPAVSPPTVRAR